MSDLDPHNFCEHFQPLLAGHENFYPVVLESRYPHVLERMLALWATAEMTSYLASLLPKERRFGQGFPGDAQAEILEIKRIHEAWVEEHRLATASAPFGHLLTPEMIDAMTSTADERHLTDSTILEGKVNALRQGLNQP